MSCKTILCTRRVQLTQACGTAFAKSPGIFRWKSGQEILFLKKSICVRIFIFVCLEGILTTLPDNWNQRFEIFCSKSENEKASTFFRKVFLEIFLRTIWRQFCTTVQNFWQKSNCFAKSPKTEEKNCSSKSLFAVRCSFGHVEGSFENLDRNFWRKFQKFFTQSLKTNEKRNWKNSSPEKIPMDT